MSESNFFCCDCNKTFHFDELFAGRGVCKDCAITYLIKKYSEHTKTIKELKSQLNIEYKEYTDVRDELWENYLNSKGCYAVIETEENNGS